MAKKTWNEKLNDSKDLPYVADIPDCPFAQKFGPRMLVAAPLEYDEIMKKIPKGEVITMDRVREYLAKRHNADWTCFMTAGIFGNIVAHASEEREGRDPTPWWRTLKKDGELNEKYPGGVEAQRQLLEKEGFSVVQKGKRFFALDYEERLFKL
ncbi:MGMT family protein [Candidatus Saccharibacteria bacterium]|nr:MGMT family protein [Candidatus Saccharibacteria bacterium]